MSDLPDIQESGDLRGVALDNVGVTNLVYPIQVRLMDIADGEEHPSLLSTVGKFEASVRLPKIQRGTHMSRLVKAVDSNANAQMSLVHLQTVAVELCTLLEANESRLTVGFEYFLPKVAPVSHEMGYMNYSCSFIATNKFIPVWGDGKSSSAPAVSGWLAVTIPVMSLCPCSKEISDYGAHNQRCHVTVKLSFKDPGKFVWIEEVVELVEKCGSSPVYPILKRPDERFVTMHSYDNPAFVEDVARNVVVELQKDDRINEYYVEVKSRESIHNHDAFARVSGKVE